MLFCAVDGITQGESIDEAQLIALSQTDGAPADDEDGETEDSTEVPTGKLQNYFKSPVTNFVEFTFQVITQWHEVQDQASKYVASDSCV